MELPLQLEDELFLEHSSLTYFDISGPVKQVEIKVDIHLKSVLQGVIQATQEGVKAGLLFLSNQKTASKAIIWRWPGQRHSCICRKYSFEYTDKWYQICFSEEKKYLETACLP